MSDVSERNNDAEVPQLRRETIWPSRPAPALLVFYITITYVFLYVASAVITFLPFGLLHHLVMPIETMP